MNTPRESLQNRDNWQEEAGERGRTDEDKFFNCLRDYFVGAPYSIENQPKDLARIYGSRGIKPDHVIRNSQTGRSIFVEVKRQRAAGNAHERACKFFTPGIVNAGRRIGNIRQKDFPYWMVFTNGIASDEKYREEINFWFESVQGALLLWTDIANCNLVIAHFEKHIKPILS